MTSNGTPTLRVGVWKRRESCILIIYKNKACLEKANVPQLINTTSTLKQFIPEDICL